MSRLLTCRWQDVLLHYDEPYRVSKAKRNASLTVWGIGIYYKHRDQSLSLCKKRQRYPDGKELISPYIEHSLHFNPSVDHNLCLRSSALADVVAGLQQVSRRNNFNCDKLYWSLGFVEITWENWYCISYTTDFCSRRPVVNHPYSRYPLGSPTSYDNSRYSLYGRWKRK